jgi:ribosomal protein S18 acetylase RimI-like enzyme
MQIREVSPEELNYVAAVCLDPSVPPRWREIMEPCMVERKKWLKTMMAKGLQVSVALEEPKVVAKSLGSKTKKVKAKSLRSNIAKGLIEYVPIEFACEPVEGEDELFINCIWVVPPFWHRGVARALLERCIEKAKAYGGVSVLAYEGDRWFGFFPCMPASFFEKFGFKEVDRDGSRVLLHLNLGGDRKPRLIKTKTRKVGKKDKLMVDVLYSSQCPWSGWMVDKVKRGMKKYHAVVNAINTDDRRNIEEYGLSRGVCVNGAPIIKRMASWKEIESIIKQASQH